MKATIGFLLAIIFLICPHIVRAAEQLRYFESVDDMTKIWFLEFDKGKDVMGLFKVTGVKHDGVDHVYEFKKDAGNPPKRRFSTNGAAKFTFLDYDMYRYLEGSQKRIWQFYGTRGNDVGVDLVEKTPPASPTAQELRAQYERDEQGADAKDAAGVSSAAGSLMTKDCQGKVALQFSPGDFVGAGKPAVQRAFAVAQGVADLCKSDEDYRKAVLEAGKIVVGVAVGANIEFVKGSKPPTIKVARDAPNTRSISKKLLTEGM
jgi:hypothetical protein